MEDYVAQAMALAAMAKAKGGTTDAYTKAETDALLDGKADLVDGKIPASELPSYVDDVLEYASTAAFPATGESGKIYVDTDTNKTYRWGGSAYVEISESLALGETASTAYAGNKGKANADAIAAIKDGTNIDSFADVETALENIPSVTVDQTFDPTSANAQSGVAVQEALANVGKLTSIGVINSLDMTTANEQSLTTSEAIKNFHLYFVNLQVSSGITSTITIPIVTGFATASSFEVYISNTHVCTMDIRLSGSNNSMVRLTNRNTGLNATIYFELFKLG